LGKVSNESNEKKELGTHLPAFQTRAVFSNVKDMAVVYDLCEAPPDNFERKYVFRAVFGPIRNDFRAKTKRHCRVFLGLLSFSPKQETALDC
jgi:hypothetical protein